MNYSVIKCPDIANGPGNRVSLFVSGCRNHCKGCFQPETWDFKYGDKFTAETVSTILRKLRPSYIKGLSILGGDPLEPENQIAVLALCDAVKQYYPHKDIWLWTGYHWEEMQDIPIMRYIDVLVDGPFIEEKKNLNLRFRGSENQRIIDVQKSTEVGHAILWEDPAMPELCGQSYL